MLQFNKRRENSRSEVFNFVWLQKPETKTRKTINQLSNCKKKKKSIVVTKGKEAKKSVFYSKDRKRTIWLDLNKL